MSQQERARFNRRVTENAEGCHVWTGPLDKDGYGTFWLRRLNRRAHRVAYWASVGDIPEKLHIDHTCRNPSCVNPAHLRVLTPRENTLAGTSPVAKNAAKATCPRGHAYDRKYGKQRYCSTCEAAKRVRLREKWRKEDTVAC